MSENEPHYHANEPEMTGEFYDDHEKVEIDRDTIESIEEAAKIESPELSDAAVTGLVDGSLLEKTGSILNHPHSAEFNAKIHEAASLIAVEGADEFYGKPSDGQNPITVLELEEHGELLDDVLKSYMEVGAFDDATMLANAIDGLTKTDVFLEQKGQYIPPVAPELEFDSPEAIAKTHIDAAIDAHLDYTAELDTTSDDEEPAYDDEPEFGDEEPFSYSTKESTELADDEINPISGLRNWEHKLLYDYEEGEDSFTIPRSTGEPEYYDSFEEEDDDEADGTAEQKFWLETAAMLPPVTLNNILNHRLNDVELQVVAEGTYEISIGPAKPEEFLDTSEIKARFEVDHVVKEAPHIADQMRETDRTNVITRLEGFGKAMHTQTSKSDYYVSRFEQTEHEVLVSLHAYLDEAKSADGVLSQQRREQAATMIDNLTYIGNKEYAEATQGIADYWKACLDANPDLQLLAIAGEIGKDYQNEHHMKQIKSDDYLLDNILAHFSDEDLEKYGNRLITEAYEVTAHEPKDLKVVLLDDWTISGSQLRGVRGDFLEYHPHFESSIEVQLIAANRKRVTTGLEYGDFIRPENNKLATPVRAYYLAHESTMLHAPNSGAHITGSHSSVDYDVEDEWEYMTHEANEHREELDAHQLILTTLPAAANIVRPYRMEGVVLENRRRLEERNRQAVSRGISF